jgi:hypothetical protein
MIWVRLGHSTSVLDPSKHFWTPLVSPVNETRFWGTECAELIIIMGRTLRKTSWTYLETIFHGASNGTGPIQNKNFKMIENIFGKFFSKFSGIWIFSIGISIQNLDIS